MADRRTRGTTGSVQGRSTAARAVAMAEQLQHDCSILLELYRHKETLPVDIAVGDSRMVTVPLPSPQMDPRDRLWCIHTALLQCQGLLGRAITKEEEEMGSDENREYETQRKVVKEQLSFLLFNTGELLKAVDGPAVVTPSLEGLEVHDSTMFELKLWIFRIFKEVDYWAKMTITTLKSLPSVIAKERVRTARHRNLRNRR